MKKIVTGALVMTLLIALSSASASSAGGATDPLVTRSYAEGAYRTALTDSLISSAGARLQELFDRAAAPYQGDGDTAINYTSGREGWRLASGGIRVPSGGTVTPTSGSLTLSELRGELVDTTTGQTVAPGTALTQFHRYLVTEEAEAYLTCASPALFYLDGPYITLDALERQYSYYNDVAGSEWYYDAAKYVKDNRLFHDWDSASFNGRLPATRAEMVYALWVMAGSPVPTMDSGFTDLSEDWYRDAVSWAAETGITTGISPTEFDPNGLVKRSQMAAFFYRCTAWQGGRTDQRADLTVYTDSAKIPEWAIDALSWATAINVIRGNDDRTVAPSSSSTRAQLAAVIMRWEEADLA